MEIVDIEPCKECGCIKGTRVSDAHPALAECVECQHLCDVSNNNINKQERTYL